MMNDNPRLDYSDAYPEKSIEQLVVFPINRDKPGEPQVNIFSPESQTLAMKLNEVIDTVNGLIKAVDVLNGLIVNKYGEGEVVDE